VPLVPPRIDLIGADDRPPGAETLTITRHTGVAETIGVGRFVDEGLDPELEVRRREHVADCDYDMWVMRLPTTGMSLPGEASPVSELLWCAFHGCLDMRLSAATAQEQDWGWHAESYV
jgi:hypothetical protein